MQRTPIATRAGVSGVMLALAGSLISLSAPRATAATSPFQSSDPAVIQAAAEVQYWTEVVAFYTQVKKALRAEIAAATTAKQTDWDGLSRWYPTRPKIYLKTRFLDIPLTAAGLQEWASKRFPNGYAKGESIQTPGDMLDTMRKLGNFYIPGTKLQLRAVTGTLLPNAELELDNAQDKLDQLLHPQTEPINQPAATP